MTTPRKPPCPPLSRRQALAAFGGAAAAAAGAGCRRGWSPPEDDPTGRAIVKPHVPGADRYATHEERWFHSSCAQCPASCGIRVRVVEGRAVRVEGNRANPVNRGGIGARGLSSLQGLYDADRLKGPLVREAGRLVESSWDQALGIVGDRLTTLRASGAAHRLLVWSGRERGPMHELLERFARAYGTPNFIDGRPGRTGALAQAMAAMVGVPEVPAYAWGDANYLLSLEAALLEDSCQSVHFSRAAGARLHEDTGQRARLVHAGPMYDLSAHNADEWIRLRPGTSGALALGLCHLILAAHPEAGALPEGLATALHGEDGFLAAIRQFGPERASAATGVAPRILERLASRLWDRRPALAIVDERSLSYTNAWETALAAMALNTMLGAMWPPNAGVHFTPDAPLQRWPTVATDVVADRGLAVPRLDRAGTDEFPLAGCVHETLPEAMDAAGPDAPDIALLHHANPAYARQQPARWVEALQRIPLVVSFSPYRDETVEEIAHVVLPDHTFLERWEITTPAPAANRAVVGVRRPVIEPLYDTRPSGDVVVQLAQQVGGTVAEAFPWESYRKALEYRLDGIVAARRGSIVATSRRELIDQLHEDGFWADDLQPDVPVSVALRALYTDPQWHGNASRYPLKLIAYRPLGYAEGSGANMPWLRTLRDRPDARPWKLVARVNPASINETIRDGTTVTVSSEWGAATLPLAIDERMSPGYVAIPMGGGHRAYGRWARGFGVNVMELLRPGAAPITGTNVLCATRVRIDKGGGQPT